MQLRASSDTVLCTIEQFWSPLLFGIFYVFGADFLAFFCGKCVFGVEEMLIQISTVAFSRPVGKYANT